MLFRFQRRFFWACYLCESAYLLGRGISIETVVKVKVLHRGENLKLLNRFLKYNLFGFYLCLVVVKLAKSSYNWNKLKYEQNHKNERVTIKKGVCL